VCKFLKWLWWYHLRIFTYVPTIVSDLLLTFISTSSPWWYGYVLPVSLLLFSKSLHVYSLIVSSSSLVHTIIHIHVARDLFISTKLVELVLRVRLPLHFYYMYLLYYISSHRMWVLLVIEDTSKLKEILNCIHINLFLLIYETDYLFITRIIIYIFVLRWLSSLTHIQACSVNSQIRRYYDCYFLWSHFCTSPNNDWQNTDRKPPQIYSFSWRFLIVISWRRIPVCRPKYWVLT